VHNSYVYAIYNLSPPYAHAKQFSQNECSAPALAAATAGIQFLVLLIAAINSQQASACADIEACGLQPPRMPS
jgi:hypothetical protein